MKKAILILLMALVGCSASEDEQEIIVFDYSSGSYTATSHTVCAGRPVDAVWTGTHTHSLNAFNDASCSSPVGSIIETGSAATAGILSSTEAVPGTYYFASYAFCPSGAKFSVTVIDCSVVD